MKKMKPIQNSLDGSGRKNAPNCMEMMRNPEHIASPYYFNAESCFFALFSFSNTRRQGIDVRHA
jgi:hypothetical protein